MGIEVDTRKSFLCREHGQFTAIYTWVNDERALILLNHLRPGSPFIVIGESAAWKYDDTVYLAEEARRAVDRLGMEPSMQTWMKLATIIHEGLGDLIKMPSAPPADYLKPVLGHMTLKADGQAIHSEDIRVEKSGVEYV